LFDLMANLVLFAPFGATLGSGRLDLARTALICAGLSVAGEWTQLYSHGRFPSMQDVVCNVAGGVLAARLMRSRRCPQHRRS
jgi:VanZ family protein